MSKDKGMTWEIEGQGISAVHGPYFGKKADHRIVIGKEGFHETTDGGKEWKKVAPLPQLAKKVAPLPFKRAMTLPRPGAISITVGSMPFSCRIFATWSAARLSLPGGFDVSSRISSCKSLTASSIKAGLPGLRLEVERACCEVTRQV